MVLSTTAFAANVVAFDLPVGDEHMPADLVMGETVPRYLKTLRVTTTPGRQSKTAL